MDHLTLQTEWQVLKILRRQLMNIPGYSLEQCRRSRKPQKAQMRFTSNNVLLFFRLPILITTYQDLFFRTLFKIAQKVTERGEVRSESKTENDLQSEYLMYICIIHTPNNFFKIGTFNSRPFSSVIFWISYKLRFLFQFSNNFEQTKTLGTENNLHVSHQFSESEAQTNLVVSRVVGLRRTAMKCTCTKTY